MIEYMRMDQTHVSEIAHLETICFSSPWSERSVAAELDNPLSCWIVAIEGGCLAGYVGSQAVLGEADMMNIAVSPEFRRRGVALGLVNALISDLKTADVHSLTLEVRSSNEPAKALYNKLGFQQVGCRPNYYRNPKEDALILRKEWAL